MKVGKPGVTVQTTAGYYVKATPQELAGRRVTPYRRPRGSRGW